MPQTAQKLLGILLGTALYAFGLHYFVISNELMEGGVTGIALLLHYAFGLLPSVTTLVLNVPLFLLGWKALGRNQLLLTLFGTFALSFFLWVMEAAIARGWIVPFRTTQDYFLATLYAGVTIGVGLGIVLRFGGTTGGTDILARIFHVWRGWSIGQIILVMDVVVIGASLIYIPKEKVLYTLVAVFVASKVIDFITDGAYEARAVTVITDHGETMAAAITEQMDRGVTLLAAKGAFSGRPKHMVYCVVSRSELQTLKAIARRIDPAGFIVISDVHDVLGEGFRAD